LRLRIGARRQAKRRVDLRGRAGAAPRRVSRGRRRAKERTMTPYRAALALFVLLLLPALAAAAPEGKIVIAQGVDPTTLDPQWHEETPAYNVLLNIYDTLLFRDKDLKIIPWLAESWRLVNPTTWEFKIRKGVKFHNGEEVDAEAVKFSLDRIRDPELKARQTVYFRLVTSVDVVDKHTVRVVTSRPYPTLENHLALRGAIMPPGHFRGKDKVFADRNPVGSGPYKFVRWVTDEQIELEADPSWWGGAPKIKTIVFPPIPEHAVRAAALHAGWMSVRVRKHLAEAGFPQVLDLTLNSPDGRYQKDKEVAEAVAGQLTKAGIRTRVKTHEWTTYLSQYVYPHKANPMYLIGWGNTTWDADGTIGALFRTGTPQSNYHNPDFDGLIDEAQTSIDPRQRQELYARAQRSIVDDATPLPP